MNRFGGIQRLYGDDGLEKILNANIAVVGIGGVGSWAAEALARSGVGRITLIDNDVLCETNINRQVHALTETLEKSKVAVMAARLKQINPELIIEELITYITKDNSADLIDNRFDYVIDGIDSVMSKAALIAFCKRNKIPLITIGAAGGQTDPTKITIKDLSKATVDPLLAKIRNELRRHYNYPRNVKRSFSVEAVYSEQQLIYPQQDGTVSQARPRDQELADMNCSGGFGAASFVTAGFAFAAVSRVLQKITG
jgi:tRNA A37 threonylcarbamoyladenosine dehydratase